MKDDTHQMLSGKMLRPRGEEQEHDHISTSLLVLFIRWFISKCTDKTRSASELPTCGDQVDGDGDDDGDDNRCRGWCRSR